MITNNKKCFNSNVSKLKLLYKIVCRKILFIALFIIMFVKELEKLTVTGAYRLNPQQNWRWNKCARWKQVNHGFPVTKLMTVLKPNCNYNLWRIQINFCTSFFIFKDKTGDNWEGNGFARRHGGLVASKWER